MIALLKKEMFNDRIREILSFVPSAIFPAIIFPAIFLDNSGDFQLENNPKIMAAIIAIIAAIILGLSSICIVPLLSKKIAGNIIAGNIADGT